MSSFLLVASLRIYTGHKPGSSTGRAYHKRTYKSQKLAEWSKLQPQRDAWVQIKVYAGLMTVDFEHNRYIVQLEGMKVM